MDCELQVYMEYQAQQHGAMPRLAASPNYLP